MTFLFDFSIQQVLDYRDHRFQKHQKSLLLRISEVHYRALINLDYRDFLCKNHNNQISPEKSR